MDRTSRWNPFYTERVKRILIVDDEPQITRMLRAALQSSGYEAILAKDGLEGFQRFEEDHPDLVVTDLAMPEMDGLQLTEAIRRVSLKPIIVLSVRDTDRLKIKALDAGADDYLTKPFSTPELLARVRVQLRRTAEPEPVLIEAGDFTFDAKAHMASLRGQPLHLTPKEFELLGLLLQNADRVMTHKVLLKAIWGPAGEGQPEYLRVLVGQLRKKLEGKGLRYIVSEPWVGYRLQTEVCSEDPPSKG